MCQKCEWRDVLAELDDLCADNDYEWANDTLAGIGEWVEEHQHVTKGQIDAIENIKGRVEDRQ